MDDHASTTVMARRRSEGSPSSEREPTARAERGAHPECVSRCVRVDHTGHDRTLGYLVWVSRSR